MLNLYSHQKKIIDEDPLKTGLFLSCGTGKTLTALLLAEGNTLIVAPKTIRDDKVWERQFEKTSNNIFIKVLSKEEFKRDHTKLPRFDTVIFDESHTVCGLTANIRYRKRLEVPKASQIFEACQAYIERTNPTRIYLATATPIRNPMAVLAAAWLLGRSWDFYNWRSIFYTRIPMPGRAQIWMPKKDEDTKNRLAKAVQGLGYTGRLSDFTDVPEQTHIVKNIPLTAEQVKALKEVPMNYPDPIVLVGKKHQIEQGFLNDTEVVYFDNGKIDAIIEMTEQYEKILVFAKYTAQIKMIEKALKNIPVFVLTGATKDRRSLIKEAEESDRCVVICQSQISAGYELPSFRCTIFASESWSYVDHEQSLGRTLRMNNLAKNLYVYLVSGPIDKSVRDTLLMKKDFSERIYLGK